MKKRAGKKRRSRPLWEKIDGVTIFLRGRKWWIEFCRNGRQKRETLNTRDHEIAVRRASRIAAGLAAGAVMADPLERKTLSAAVRVYLDEFGARASKKQSADKRHKLKRLQAWLDRENHGDPGLEMLTPEILEKYYRHLTAEYANRATRKSHHIEIRAFFNAATAKGWIGESPLYVRTQGRKIPLDRHTWEREEERLPVYLDPESVGTFFKIARKNDPLVYRVALLCRWAALRLMEALRLRRQDCDLAGSNPHFTIRFQEASGFKPKGRRERVVPVVEPLLGQIRKWVRELSHDDELLVKPDGMKPGSKGFWKFDDRVRDLCDNHGAPKIRMKDLRSTAACAFLEAGMDLFFVRDMLGHASIQTTERYYARVRAAKLGEAMRAAAPLQGMTAKTKTQRKAQ